MLFLPRRLLALLLRRRLILGLGGRVDPCRLLNYLLLRLGRIVLLLLLLGRPFLVLAASTETLKQCSENVPEEAHRGDWGAGVKLRS